MLTVSLCLLIDRGVHRLLLRGHPVRRRRDPIHRGEDHVPEPGRLPGSLGTEHLHRPSEVDQQALLDRGDQ